MCICKSQNLKGKEEDCLVINSVNNKHTQTLVAFAFPPIPNFIHLCGVVSKGVCVCLFANKNVKLELFRNFVFFSGRL